MSFGEMKKVLLYINLTKVAYNLRPTLLLEISFGLLFTMHQLLPHLLLLFSYLLGKW